MWGSSAGVFIAAVAAAASDYERRCDEIVAAGRAAAGLYNSGDAAGAEKALGRSDAALDAATALAPDEPQAYLNAAARRRGRELRNPSPLSSSPRRRRVVATASSPRRGHGVATASQRRRQVVATASPRRRRVVAASSPRRRSIVATASPRRRRATTAQSNEPTRHRRAVQRAYPQANVALHSRRFERSLQLWAAAEARCGDHAACKKHVAERFQTTRLGLASVRRDEAYANGRGSIADAIHWAEAQNEAAPGNPRAEHDLAVLCRGRAVRLS